MLEQLIHKGKKLRLKNKITFFRFGAYASTESNKYDPESEAVVTAKAAEKARLARVWIYVLLLLLVCFVLVCVVIFMLGIKITKNI